MSHLAKKAGKTEYKIRNAYKPNKIQISFQF